MKTLFNILFKLLLPYFMISFISVFIVLVVFTSIIQSSSGLIISYINVMVLLLGCYYLMLSTNKKLDKTFIKMNFIYIILIGLVFATTFALSNASLTNPIMSINYGLIFPFMPIIFMTSLIWDLYGAIISIGIICAFSLLFTCLFSKNFKLLKFSLCFILIIGSFGTFTYLNSPNFKYQGHGFDYMHGYSSVDLSDYMVYSNSNKLVELDHEASLIIEDVTSMPILDGAEACFPVYSAIAKAVYKNIDIIERNATQDYFNGRIVTFFNTAEGYERLFSGEVDMFFGAKPSKGQLERAKELGVELEYTLIGKEAFVFFVNENNPIDELSSDEIRKIYHGDITNFKEVGGSNEKIIAFQRPERSGSQAMMQYFMGDISLKEPIKVEMQAAMSGIIRQVADYYNEDGAIGYTFKYFLEGLNQEENVKILSIDGTYPTKENISNGSYPLIAGFYCVTVKGNDHPYIDDMLEFILSEDGQTIIEETGYIPVK